jgi:hypothetical protein
MNNEPVAWMPVIGFENQYEVSNAGDIKNVKSGRILAKSIMGAGYYKADLWSFGKRRQTSIHRVVAGAFLGIPVDGMEVNHKDGNKLNNHVSNLEWVTRSENEQHSREVLGNLCKPVKAICLKTGEVRIYPSQTATAKDGFEPKCVSDICLKKDRYTHKGWAFEYYTHPADESFDRTASHMAGEYVSYPAKILTEPSVKEITDLWLDVINNIPANDKRPREWHFANAILRKAQEK